jgi:hypothetical protein
MQYGWKMPGAPRLAIVRPFDEYRPKQKDRKPRVPKAKTIGIFWPVPLPKHEQARLLDRLCYGRI